MKLRTEEIKIVHPSFLLSLAAIKAYTESRTKKGLDNVHSGISVLTAVGHLTQFCCLST